MEVDTAIEICASRIHAQPWSPMTRIAFRFCLVYFGLYCLGTQIINSVLAVPKVDVPDWGTLWPVRPLIFWVGAHLSA